MSEEKKVNVNEEACKLEDENLETVNGGAVVRGIRDGNNGMKDGARFGMKDGLTSTVASN